MMYILMVSEIVKVFLLMENLLKWLMRYSHTKNSSMHIRKIQKNLLLKCQYVPFY